MNKQLKKKINLNLVKNYLLFRKKKNYLDNKVKYTSNIYLNNIIFVESFYYDNTILRKQFFLGICISKEKGKIKSSVTLRNVLNGYLVDQKFLIFNNLILSLRISKKRKLNIKKNKLFFLKNLPFLFRINKFVLNETFFYLKKKKNK